MYTHCMKCRGAGYIPQYSHIDGGVCYDCDGSGYEYSLPPPPQKKISPKEGDYGVISRLDGGEISTVLCKSWEDAYKVKQRRKKDDRYYDLRICKFVGGKWLDRQQFLQSVGK